VEVQCGKALVGYSVAQLGISLLQTTTSTKASLGLRCGGRPTGPGTLKGEGLVTGH